MLPKFPCAPWYLRKIPKEEQEDKSVQDGMSVSQVVLNQVAACKFIQDLGKKLHFPYRTIATSQLYFHVFFNCHSMKEHPHLDIALTAILVASKAEETYKKIRQILSAAFLILNPGFSGSEVDVTIVEDHRKKVIQYEEVMLQTIEFNFNVRHAFEVLAQLGHLIDLSQDLVSRAFTILQQLYFTPLILYYPPHYIALGAILQAHTELGRRTGQVLGLVRDINVGLEDVEDLLKRYNFFWDIVDRRKLQDQ